jgi:hypothetical protein
MDNDMRDKCPVRSAYQPPASSTFLSEQTNHQQPASITFISEQTSTSHQQPANEQAKEQGKKGQKVGRKWRIQESSNYYLF